MSTSAPIADWLARPGVGQYAQRFVENEIYFSILPDLIDADFQELGVTALGHRRLLLRAIATLDNMGNPRVPLPRPWPVTPQQPDFAERRQVTVMFVDLVGSTALSARSDPETCARSFLLVRRASPRQSRASADLWQSTWVTVWSRTLAQAHVHDTERAIRAGLELIEAIHALRSSPPLQARVALQPDWSLSARCLIGRGVNQSPVSETSA